MRVNPTFPLAQTNVHSDLALFSGKAQSGGLGDVVSEMTVRLRQRVGMNIRLFVLLLLGAQMTFSLSDKPTTRTSDRD